MAYSNFTFKDLKADFDVENRVGKLFSDIKEIQASERLLEDLEIAKTQPVRSEKAKSEFIVKPILVELLKLNDRFFSIHSGDQLNADKERGLVGECDFILARNAGTYDIHTPIITIVEAKKHDLEAGTSQCAAQLIGAREYNKIYDNSVDVLYGCVTNGKLWQFLKLENNIIWVDEEEYTLEPLPKLLGTFQNIINYYKKHVN